MADSRRPRRRTVGASSSRSRDARFASIEGWISNRVKYADFANFWILEYKGVRIEGDLTQAIQAFGTKIGEITFLQMGFVAHGRVVIHKDDDHQGDDDDDIDAHMAEPVEGAAPSEAGPSTMPSPSSLSIEEYFVNLSKQLKDMSLAHQASFDELIELQQTHEEYVI
ncbi:hypothetical protein LR48_Vigan11g059200 [Vigna angularis]|uniref:Uncharacterized protein n=1 Tax=Phaseolus angularis TaxID=3914 RepID=A0A0L9VS41_PHAAN|nr:hypothetical protein LR48_Vigan11g059200 [Vigna angularis]